MTDVTLNGSQAGAELSAADEQLLRELTERARAGGLKLTGEGGLLGKLTKMVVEGALEGERPAIGNLVVSATQTNKSSARQTRLLNGRDGQSGSRRPSKQIAESGFLMVS